MEHPCLEELLYWPSPLDISLQHLQLANADLHW